MLGILIHEPHDVRLQRLAVENYGLHIHQQVQRARRLGRRRVALLVHGGAIDRHVAGHYDTLLAAAQRELYLAFAHGANDAAIGAVEGWLVLYLEC